MACEKFDALDGLEKEIRRLPALARRILNNRRRILSLWQELCRVCLPLEALKTDDFVRRLDRAIVHAKSGLSRGDLQAYAAAIDRLGEAMRERQVSLSDALIVSELFQASVSRVLAAGSLDAEDWCALQRLGLARGRLLARSYLSTQYGSDAFANSLPTLPVDNGLADPRVPRLVGKSRLMHRLAEQILAVAAHSVTVLVKGETGTGKELVARAIHECGAGASAPFVAVNCAAIPKDLIESELFGYRKGAFSGAASDYPGLFQAADGGTLFLDEITEMPPEFQGKLLRALQERAIRPVGCTHELPVTLRVIASTNREPPEAVRAGRLRQDLYYRLEASVLSVPPLRARSEDIPLLVRHFIALARRNSGSTLGAPRVDADALVSLMSYRWPGNVRQLSNVIESACLFGRGATLRRTDLPPEITATDSAEYDDPSLFAQVSSLRDGEELLIRAALAATHGNKARAAAQLQISRKALYAKMTRYGMREL